MNRLLFTSPSLPPRQLKAMFRAGSMRVATPKAQAKAFPPPPPNPWVATAGTVLHRPAQPSHVQALRSSLSGKLGDDGLHSQAGSPEDGRRVNASAFWLPPGRVRQCHDKSWPQKHLEKQPTRKGKKHALGFQISDSKLSWKLRMNTTSIRWSLLL